MNKPHFRLGQIIQEFLKKFYLNTENQNISFNTSGKITLIEKKIKFDNLIINNQKLEGKNLNLVEDSFNTHVIKDSVLGSLDFFKIKKFVREAHEILE